jgi:hypothetical protein
MKDLNMISFYTNRKNRISTDDYKNTQSVKVKNKHKTGGKPMETYVKLFKCIENKVKLVKAPIDNYDVKKDCERMNKELIEAAQTFKHAGLNERSIRFSCKRPRCTGRH